MRPAASQDSRIDTRPRCARVPFVLCPLSFVLAAAVLAACGAGPRMRYLADRHYPPFDPGVQIDAFLGTVTGNPEPIAIIESDASPYADDAVKQRQLAQLREKARGLGANAIQDVRILTKRIRGYTPDERSPIAAWQQGRYELYFMRAMAVRRTVPEPRTLDDAAPRDGWIVDRFPTPQRIEDVLEPGARSPRP